MVFIIAEKSIQYELPFKMKFTVLYFGGTVPAETLNTGELECNIGMGSILHALFFPSIHSQYFECGG